MDIRNRFFQDNVPSLENMIIKKLGIPELNKQVGVYPVLSLYNPMLIKHLFIHIVAGNQLAAEEMLKHNPRLLLEEDIVTNYAGQLIEGTPFEYALGAEDTEMCEMMLPYFNQLTDGYLEALRQYENQYPIVPIKPSIYSFDALVAAISKETFINGEQNENTKLALDNFRNDFKPHAVGKGQHFSIQTLIDALHLYNQQVETWSNAQSSLFWREVIGFLQRRVPTCYAQAFCQGIPDLLESGKLIRSLALRDKSLYFPLDANPEERLGFDFALYAGHKLQMKNAEGESNKMTLWTEALEKLYQLKVATIKNLKTTLLDAAREHTVKIGIK